MNKKPVGEDLLRTKEALKSVPKPSSSQKLLHELQLHQVELEAQNERLRQAQVELEKSRDRFADLYDFAPVGYLTLNRMGVIDEINLTGASLLGMDRTKLPHKRLDSFVAIEDKARWLRHFLEVQKCNDTRTCELVIQRSDKSHFHAQLDCLFLKEDGKKPAVRIAFVDITQRHALVDAIKQSKRFFSTLTKISPVGIYRTDAQGNGLYSNERFQKIIYMTAVEALGVGWLQAIHPDDREKVANAWHTSVQARQNFMMEYRIRQPDGTSCWVLGQATAERDAAGEVVGYVGTLTDITHSKQAEMQQKKLLSLLYATLDSTTDAILVVDLNNSWVLHNQKFIDLWHITNEIIASRNDQAALSYVLNQLVDPEGFLHKVYELYATPEASSFDTLEFKDGKLIERYSIPQRIDGNVLGRVWSFRDITERKQAELQRHLAQVAIQNSEEMFRAMSASAQDAIIVIDNDGSVSFWNSAAEKMFGYTRVEAVGVPLESLIIPSRFCDAHCKGFANFRRTGAGGFIGKTIELTASRKAGGEFQIELSLSTANISGCWQAVGSIRDITGRKQAELKAAALIHRNQVLMQSTPEFIHILDEHGNLIEANDAFCRHLGYTEAEALQLCVPDFDAKFTADEVQAAIDNLWGSHATFETIHRRKDGAMVDVEVTVSGVELDGQKCLFALARDITQRKQAEEKIRSLAFYDTLTQLPNRRLLMDRLKQALASSARSGREGALLFIDLDKFKTLNDSLGHDIGDLLLQQVARRLESCIREGDTVARLGGDEFVVMLEDLSEYSMEAAAQAEAVGDKILSALNLPYQLAAHEHLSTPSIGVTFFSGAGQSQDELLVQADIAMYQAKKAGRNVMRFFDPDMQAIIAARALQETDLRRAIAEQGQFRLHYQPQIDSTGQVIGAEALVRWHHPKHGLMHPGEFIPLAEETGLILPLGHWVLTAACRQLAAWALLPESAHLTLAVNVCAKQLHLPTFVEEVTTLIHHFGVNPAKLKLEITESMLLDNAEDTIANMTILKARGITFSMDDFGTGYSSLQYLKRLPIDQLKIDQSFVRDIATDDSDKMIVQTIIAMAHGLNLNVIAEGVETMAQRQFLLDRGCTTFQGYLLGRPVPIEQFDTPPR